MLQVIIDHRASAHIPAFLDACFAMIGMLH